MPAERIPGWCRVPVASLMLLSTLLVGCPDGEATSPPTGMTVPAFQGVEVRCAVPAGWTLAETWAPALNDWSDERDASAVLDETNWSAETIAEWIARTPPTGTSVPPTLVILPTPLMNELIAAERVASIPGETLTNEVFNWNQIPPTVRSTLGTLDDQPAIVPVSSPTPVICYRADLLETSGRQPPVTWADYDRLVSELPQWAPDHVAVEPWADESLATVFLARALSGARHPAQFSFELDAATGVPLIASPPFERALDELRALAPHLAPQVHELDPQGCLQALNSGQAAIGLVWETTSPRSAPEGNAGTADDPRRGPLAFVPLPGRTEVYDRDRQQWRSPPTSDVNRPALAGFAGLSVCVLASATEIERAAAWDLWALLDAYQSTGTIPPLPGLRLTAEASSAQQSPHLSPGESQSFQRAAMAGLQNQLLVSELPVPGRDRLLSALTVAIHQTLQEDKPSLASLQQAAEQWVSSIDQIGRLKVVNCYRQRLGLSPLSQ